MSIIINLDVMMAKRKKGLKELAGEVDITLANLSILKNNKAKAVRLSTLDAICTASPEIFWSMWRIRQRLGAMRAGSPEYILTDSVTGGEHFAIACRQYLYRKEII